MTPSRHRVVVIGSGFGGLFSAKALRRADVEVTLIARTTHHLFQPLLYQVATGILSEGEIAAPTRMILKNQQNTTVVLGDVETIDLSARTVTSRHAAQTTVTEYDSLIVAAGAQQSYFGNNHFAEHAPGLKTVDDALELRGRILSSFDRAELTDDEDERRRLLTFVVVGAGPTGVEMAGQIAELARHTMVGTYRNIDSRDAQVILLDAAPAVLPPFGEKLGTAAAKSLSKRGVQVQLGAAVTSVDAEGLIVRDKDGSERRIDATCKVWSAGVAASPLGAQLAAQTDSEIDRAGRIHVQPDLSLRGYRNVFVVGDMMNLDQLPGVAQVAIQTGRYAAQQIVADAKARAAGKLQPERRPFVYTDKGSMATIARFQAVAKIGPIELTGLIAWVLWLVVHLAYIVGFKSRLTTVLSWMATFFGHNRGQLVITEQQTVARSAIGELHTLQLQRSADTARAS
jgi:NADH dehydrogenase